MPRPLLLLVDDSPAMGLIVANLGKRAGCEVHTCMDAEAAWDALPRRRPDLVLLDVNLPGASGIDWLLRIRAAAPFADLPVALYTHWGLPRDLIAGLNAGVDFLFNKDLASRPADWQGRLREILATVVDAGAPGTWPNPGPMGNMGEGGQAVPTPRDWSLALNQALLHPTLRRVPREVVLVILRRALTQTFLPRILPQELDAWIAPDGLDPDRSPPSLAPDSPQHLAVCLAEPFKRLLGNEAGAAFRDALTAMLSGVGGSRRHS